MHQRYSTGIHGPDWITILAGWRNRLLISLVAMGLMLSGCASPGALPDGSQPVAGAGITATAPDTAAPSLSEMEVMLNAELARLGKTTMAAGDYLPPSGDMNIPFDLHAQVIDPDGEGGADPLGVHVSWTERLVGDYNMDGLVNASDLTPLGQYYEQTVEYRDPAAMGGVTDWPEGTAMDDAVPTHLSPWRLARIDGNGDGLINLSDITPIAQHWQERITHYAFMVSRDGGTPQAIMNPEDPMQLYLADFSSTPLKDSYGEDWPNVPVMYEINLAIAVEAGDRLFINPISGQDSGLQYSAECTMEKPSWHWDETIDSTAYAIWDAFAVRIYQGDESLGLVVYAKEYLCGDMDGNGICHPIEFALLGKYFGVVAADYDEPAKTIIVRLDTNRNGIPEVSDLNALGHTINHRLDGIAFALRESYFEFLPVMSADDPNRRVVIPRSFGYKPDQDYVYQGWIPDLPGESDLGICLVSSDAVEPAISEPRFYPIVPGTASSLPGEVANVTAVIVRRGVELLGVASFSKVGKIVEYAWDADNDGTIDHFEDSFSIEDLTAGEHLLTLRVSDDQGNSAVAEMTVTIAE